MSARWVSPSAIRHEAGHAVMHWHTRQPFRYATVDPRNPEYVGFVYPYNPGRERRLTSEQACIDLLMRRAAGPIAENYFNTHAPYRD
jgi:hypothetical protein